MMDLYSVLVEGLFGSVILSWLILAAAIFLYLAYCKVGIYSNLIILELFSLIFFWITGNMLFVGIMLIAMWYGAFIEFKKELAEG